MRELVKSSVVRKIVLGCVVASMIPAVAFGSRAATGGELILCSASGLRVATGTFTFTFVTLASQGGTTTLNVPVGTCTGRLFYPVGASVTVTENLPASYAVTGIAIGPTPGGVGTTSVITSNTPAAGSAVITVGSGQATLTSHGQPRASPVARRAARSLSCAPLVPAAQRSDLNAACTSVAKSSGSSQAAKWPPLSTSLK